MAAKILSISAIMTAISKNMVVRQLLARPRLAAAGSAGALVYFFLPKSMVALEITRFIIGWTSTACLYVLLGAIMVARSTRAQMNRRALLEDEGQWVILATVVCAAIASLAAIFVELALAKQLSGSLKAAHIGLVALAIISSWAFTHMMFAFHYAHDFYAVRGNDATLGKFSGAPGGLVFPNDDAPDYIDFLYFAFVIGTSSQTSDVAFSSKAMRRVGLVHCVLAFIFNTTVLALMINIAASLI